MRKKDEVYKIINQFINLKFLSEEMESLYRQKLYSLQEVLEKQELRITVVGEFSSGKSTFLNAIIGKDILPHASAETTATTTYIHNVSPKDPRHNKLVVHFVDTSRKDEEIDFINHSNLLKRYLTTESDEFHVVEEIQCVDIYTTFAGPEERIVLIDTPGLNGIADGHREITIREIEKANASICLFHIRSFAESSREFLDILFRCQSFFIFVLNFIDQLHGSEGETVERKLVEFKAQLEKHYSNHSEFIEKDNCFALSSLQALVFKDKTIPRLYYDDQEDLSEEERNQYWNLSRFDLFEKYLWKQVVEKERNRIFEESIRQKLIHHIEHLMEQIHHEKTLSGKKIAQTQEMEILRRIERFEELNRKQWEEILSFIDRLARSLTSRMKKRVKQDLQSLEQTIQQQINAQCLDEFEQSLHQNEYGKQLTQLLSTLLVDYNKYLLLHLESIYQRSILKIKHYIGEVSINIDGEIKFSKVEEQEVNQSFQGKIAGLKQKKMELEDQQKEIELDKDNAERENLEINQRLIEITEKINELTQQKKQSIRNLGKSPAIEIKYEPHTYYIERSPINPMRWLFGKKDKAMTTMRPVEDRTAYDAWENRKNQLIQQHNLRIQTMKKKKETAENRKNSIKATISKDDDRLRALNSQIADLQSRIDNEKKNYEQAIRLAKRQYLERQKLTILRELADFVVKVETEFEQENEKAIWGNIGNIKEKCKEYYDQTKMEHTRKLEALLTKDGKNTFDLDAANRLSSELSQLLRRARSL